jgi:hypothetical protein
LYAPNARTKNSSDGETMNYDTKIAIIDGMIAILKALKPAAKEPQGTSRSVAVSFVKLPSTYILEMHTHPNASNVGENPEAVAWKVIASTADKWMQTLGSGTARNWADAFNAADRLRCIHQREEETRRQNANSVTTGE